MGADLSTTSAGGLKPPTNAFGLLRVRGSTGRRLAGPDDSSFYGRRLQSNHELRATQMLTFQKDLSNVSYSWPLCFNLLSRDDLQPPKKSRHLLG